MIAIKSYWETNYSTVVNLLTKDFLTSDYMIDWLQVFMQCEIVQEYYDDNIRLQIKFYQSNEKIAIYSYWETNYCTTVNLHTNDFLTSVYDWLTTSVFAMWNSTKVLWWYFTSTDIIIPTNW